MARRTRRFNAKKIVKVLVLGSIGLVIFLNSCSSYNTRRERDERINQKLAKHDQTVADYKETLSNKDEIILEKERENNKLRQEATEVEPNNVNIYIDNKFPFDGHYYREDGGIKFYEDPPCTKELTGEIRFMSNYPDPDEAENGLQIYCLRLDNGLIVYCTREKGPHLITEEEYREKYETEDE